VSLVNELDKLLKSSMSEFSSDDVKHLLDIISQYPQTPVEIETRHPMKRVDNGFGIQVLAPIHPTGSPYAFECKIYFVKLPELFGEGTGHTPESAVWSALWAFLSRIDSLGAPPWHKV
jgi:hypothetical protein